MPDYLNLTEGEAAVQRDTYSWHERQCEDCERVDEAEDEVAELEAKLVEGEARLAAVTRVLNGIRQTAMDFGHGSANSVIIARVKNALADGSLFGKASDGTSAKP